MAISGVYKIISIIKPERVYIGSSINIPRRWRSHKRKLEKGVHHAIKLQNHYDKYGIEDLVFNIIEDGVLQEDLISKEQYWMNTIQPYFNSSLTAEPGCLGYHHTEEMKGHLREVHKGKKYRLGDVNSRDHNKKISGALMGNQNSLGSIRSDKTRKKMSESKMGFKNPNWSGKYEYQYPEGLTKMQKRTYRNKIRRQTNKLLITKN